MSYLKIEQQKHGVRRRIGDMVLVITKFGVYVNRYRSHKVVKIDLDQAMGDAEASRHVTVGASSFDVGPTKYDVAITDDLIRVKPHRKGSKWSVALTAHQAYLAAQQYNGPSEAERERKKR